MGVPVCPQQKHLICVHQRGQLNVIFLSLEVQRSYMVSALVIYCVLVDIFGDREGGNYFLITVFKVKVQLTPTNQILDTIYGSNMSHTCSAVLTKAQLWWFFSTLNITYFKHDVILHTCCHVVVVMSPGQCWCYSVFVCCQTHTVKLCLYWATPTYGVCVQWWEGVYTVHMIRSPPATVTQTCSEKSHRSSFLLDCSIHVDFHIPRKTNITFFICISRLNPFPLFLFIYFLIWASHEILFA